MTQPRITLFSDLHLEFNDNFDPGTGDILILAGDICLATEVCLPGIQRFFERCAQGYNKVFYVFGNHEYYGSDMAWARDEIINNIPSSITVLNNSSQYYKGFHFVGATMWSDFSNHSSTVMENVRHRMNDYNCITNEGEKLTPELVYEMHQYTMEWFAQCLPMLNGPVFMVTHHQPSLKSIINSGYNEELAGAYCTDLCDFIKKYHNIRYWAAGHVHQSQNYHIGTCNVLANPRGYVPHSPNTNFNPQFMQTLQAPEVVL